MALSIIASLTAVGFGVGIVVAGPIVDTFGYKGLFWLPMVVTLVAAAAALLFVPESPVRTPARLPVGPALLLAGWLVALLIALSEGNQWGWTSGRILGLFAIAAVLAAAWVAVELRVPVPMIDMHMMRRRGVWTSNVVAGCVGFGMFASFGFLPQLLQTPPEAGYGFGATISESGYLLLPSAVASFLVGFATADPDSPGGRPRGHHDRAAARRALAFVSHRACSTTRPGSCTPPRPSRASAPAWSSRAWPAWWSPRCRPSRPGSRAG